MLFPQYNGIDHKIMAVVLPLGSIITNGIILRMNYISSFQSFLVATLVTLVLFGFYFRLCGGIAVTMRGRFPLEKHIPLRLGISILTFLLMSSLVIYALHLIFESIPLLHYRFNDSRFAWTYFAMGVCNIFLTFLMEGIAIYQSWASSWVETDKLNQAYKKSHLDGLRSQVNPHFLFNSLNSLSSLINEDEGKAERFLDEMSKVYRYMLRDDKQWVDLATEISFVKSYMYLLESRFGDALKLSINIPATKEGLQIAPLTLQTVIENAFMQNIVSKSHPLHIEINITQDHILTIKNNVQPKINTALVDTEASLDHLVSKYSMLKNPITIKDTDTHTRTIHIPLTVQL